MFSLDNLLLIIVCLEGFCIDHTIIFVSREPLAINNELGDHATALTRAL